MEAYGGVRNKLAYERLETRRFVARHGLTKYAHNPHFPVNTLLDHARGRGGPDAGRLFEALRRGRVRGDVGARASRWTIPMVAAAIMEEAGLPAEELLALTQDPAVKARLMANTNGRGRGGRVRYPELLRRRAADVVRQGPLARRGRSDHRVGGCLNFPPSSLWGGDRTRSVQGGALACQLKMTWRLACRTPLETAIAVCRLPTRGRLRNRRD